MLRIVFSSLVAVALAALLGGCGLAQTVADGTASTARAIFYKQVKTLHLDFSARTALNTDTSQMNALSVPTLVRVYQLRNAKAAEQATYDLWLHDDEHLLSANLLDKRSVVVKPDEGAQLNVPMDPDAQWVVVVALFRTPEAQAGSWRVVLPRDNLDPDRARVIELGDNRLTLRPLAEE